MSKFSIFAARTVEGLIGEGGKDMGHGVEKGAFEVYPPWLTISPLPGQNLN